MRAFIAGAFGLVLLLLFVGCVNQPASPDGNTSDTNAPNLIGGDKDEHGCLIAAGYSWCEQKQKCLRAWVEPCIDINTDTAPQLANMASVNCIDHNGSLTIIDTNEGQIGICTFSNGTQCEEWAYYRGDCVEGCTKNETDKSCCKSGNCVKLFDEGLPSSCSDGNLPAFTGCDVSCKPIAECKE